MNTKHHKITSTGIAALVAGCVLIAAPASVGAHDEGWDLCPALDGEPLCEILRPPHDPDGNGTEDTLGSTPNITSNQTHDAYIGCSPRPWHFFTACPS